MQWFRAVYCFEPLVFVKGTCLAHEVGEIILKSGCAHAMGACAHRVSDGSADRAHRRLSVEPAEDVARAESHE